MEEKSEVINSPTHHIRVWSYNVFLRPPPIKNNNDDYKNERFNLIIDCIDNFDIICFQEMFQTGSFRFEDMIAAGIRKGFHYWAKSEPVSFWDPTVVDSGLLIISRFPILQRSFFSFNIGIFSDSYSDKGYIYCKIGVKGKFIHIFNLHLQASFLKQDKTSFNKELSLAVRKKQCQMLKKEIKKKLEAEYEKKDLVLLLGDFNINAYCQQEIIQNSNLIKSFIPEEFGQYEQFIKLMQDREDEDRIFERQYKLKDLIFENYGYHPSTYGEQPLMILTHKQEHGIPQCLDYAFQIQDQLTKSSIFPIIENCVIQKAQVEGQPFIQLSDHYGIILELQVTKQEN